MSRPDKPGRVIVVADSDTKAAQRRFEPSRGHRHVRSVCPARALCPRHKDNKTLPFMGAFIGANNHEGKMSPFNQTESHPFVLEV